jgi:hypothetical protein
LFCHTRLRSFSDFAGEEGSRIRGFKGTRVCFLYILSVS